MVFFQFIHVLPLIISSSAITSCTSHTAPCCISPHLTSPHPPSLPKKQTFPFIDPSNPRTLEPVPRALNQGTNALILLSPSHWFLSFDIGGFPLSSFPFGRDIDKASASITIPSSVHPPPFIHPELKALLSRSASCFMLSGLSGLLFAGSTAGRCIVFSQPHTSQFSEIPNLKSETCLLAPSPRDVNIDKRVFSASAVNWIITYVQPKYLLSLPPTLPIPAREYP